MRAIRATLLLSLCIIAATAAAAAAAEGTSLPVLRVGNSTRYLELSISKCLEFVSETAETLRHSSQFYITWKQVRARVIAPALRVMIAMCLAMSVMLVVEAVFMAAVSVVVKLLRRKPEKRYKWEPMGGDEEMGSLAYPMVLIQIPMYNEKEVYKLSIGAACGLTWPSDRMIIQVLDDSTDPLVKDLVALECKVWQSKGMNIAYEVRDNRKGYKAGALRKGMEHIYVQQCEYVAIFDADFQPDSDFLLKTIPFLVHNSRIALVQARWDFGSC